MHNTTRRIATDAMLAAMFVCLSFVSIRVGNSMKISVDSLPILVAALLLGPLDGLAVGLIGSFLNQMLTYGLSVTTVLWILPAGLRGLLVGLCAKNHDFSLSRRQLVWITTATALLVTALNTLVMYLDSVIYGYYTYAYVFGGLVTRVAAGLLTAIVMAFVAPPVAERIARLAPAQK